MTFTTADTKPSKVILNIDTKPQESISFYFNEDEMLRIEPNGFYVKGKRVEADDKEAQQVYKSFKAWLVLHRLARKDTLE